MPGFTIHIATATEYMNKHKDEIKNNFEFLKGVIAPDLTERENKKITHYEYDGGGISLRKFLIKNDIDSDYNKGYFLHLITDYIFYNKILTKVSQDIYNDYDILNKYIIDKYNLKIPGEIKEKIEKEIAYKNGELKILSEEIVNKTIESSTRCSLKQIKEEILEKSFTEKWDKIRRLEIIE